MEPTSLLTAIGAEQLPSLMSKLIEMNFKSYGSDKDKTKTFIEPHIVSTYKKCSNVKTLLNPEEDVALLSIYTGQKFKISNNIYDEYDLVDFIKRGDKNYILTGTGGSGKSFFTKYLWLSLFNDSFGKIPLYVELRGLNVTSPDLLSFIRNTITGGRATISEKEFKRKIYAGEFILILDGFDELNQSSQSVVQKQIIDLVKSDKDLTIFVSSRPDYNFSSWSGFDLVNICDLTKDQCIELALKAPFSEQTKKQFANKIGSELYKKHNEFLKNPLLICMMLITFSAERDIPSSMHHFYGDAFNALYKRHDRNKEGIYKREFCAKLSEDSFRKLFSFFCLYTYQKEMYEFRHQELIEAIAESSRLSQIEVESGDFLDDITKSVCLIIRDGNFYSFAHRSFQEYFAAKCLNYVPREKASVLLKAFTSRISDQVIQLSIDMYPELVRDEFFIPFYNSNKKLFPSRASRKAVVSFASEVMYNFQVFSRAPLETHGTPKGRPQWMYAIGKHEFHAVVYAIYKECLVKGRVPDAHSNRDIEGFIDLVSNRYSLSEINKITVKFNDGNVIMNIDDNRFDITDEDWLIDTPVYEFIKTQFKAVSSFLKDKQEEANNSSILLDDLF